MGVKIRSTARMAVECDRCGSTLAVADTDDTWRAEVDMGSETVRAAALHGLLCGKNAEQVSSLHDALRAVKEAIMTGGAA